MFIFISHFKHPILVMKPHKVDRDGNVVQEPIHIQFEDNIFQTENESFASFIRSLKNFGADYFEVDKIPSHLGYQGHSVGIQKMETQETKRVESRGEIEDLKKQVASLSNLVSQLLPQKEEKESEESEKRRGRPPKES